MRNLAWFAWAILKQRWRQRHTGPPRYEEQWPPLHVVHDVDAEGHAARDRRRNDPRHARTG